jgi:hypothetical protein
MRDNRVERCTPCAGGAWPSVVQARARALFYLLYVHIYVCNIRAHRPRPRPRADGPRSAQGDQGPLPPGSRRAHIRKSNSSAHRRSFALHMPAERRKLLGRDRRGKGTMTERPTGTPLPKTSAAHPRALPAAASASPRHKRHICLICHSIVMNAVHACPRAAFVPMR